MAPYIHLYVYDGYADWEPAWAIAGIHSPDFQREPGRYQVRTVAVTQSPVRSMGGVAVLPDLLLDTVEPAASAMLILPGGPGWEQAQHQQAVDKARAFAAAGVPLAAICGATAGLARAGLLDERRHTSNALAYLKGVEEYAGSDRYEDRPAVSADGVITAGGMAPLEFAREIFSLLQVYDDAVLRAWYDLNKTGQSEHYARLVAAAEAAQVGRERKPALRAV